MNKIPKFLSRILSLLICSIGLFLQIKEVSDGYFRYPTQSKVIVLPHFGVLVPSASICLRVADIIKVEETNADLKTDIFHPKEELKDWKKWTAKSTNLTLGNRLKYTPKVDEVLDPRLGCAIRFPEKDHLEYYSAAECYQHFNVTKYYHRESVCYKFSPDLGVKELTTKHYNTSRLTWYKFRTKQLLPYPGCNFYLH